MILLAKEINVFLCLVPQCQKKICFGLYEFLIL